MISKELLQKYIEVDEYRRDLEDKLNDTFTDICPENSVWNLIPYKYAEVIWEIITQDMSSYQKDFLSWWIYEDSRYVEDGTGAGDLESFDDFYDFVFLSKPLNEILDK